MLTDLGSDNRVPKLLCMLSEARPLWSMSPELRCVGSDSRSGRRTMAAARIVDVGLKF
jgi:hypothetical protein